MNKTMAIFEAAREAFRFYPRPEEIEAFEHILSGYGFVIRTKTVTESITGTGSEEEEEEEF